MKFVNIVGPLASFESVARLTGTSGVFQPEDAIAMYSTDEDISPMAQSDPFGEAAKRLRGIYPPDGVLPAPKDVPDPGDGDALIDEADGIVLEFGEIEERIAHGERTLSETLSRRDMMSHFVGLSIDMKEISRFEFTSVRFGRMPRTAYARLEERSGEGEQAMFPFKCTESGGFTYFVIFAPKTYSREMDRILAGLHFERIFVPESVTTVESRHRQLTDEAERLEDELREARGKLASLWEERRDRIAYLDAALSRESVCAGMRRYAAVYEDKFILVGWIPAKRGRALLRALDEAEGIEVSFEGAEGGDVSDPPVLLKNSRLTRPFEMFVDMYGLPSYGEFDPTPFVALTYTVLFGIMFGDVGQGLLVSIVGALMWRLRGMKIGPILVRCGISSTVFGFVFGSVFGFEHVLDPLYRRLFGWEEKPIEVMKPATTNMIIYAAVGIGIALVAVAILINVISCAKRRDRENLFFGANGIPGLVFYCSLAGGLVCQMFLGIPVMSLPYVLCLIVLPLILIFLKEPLGFIINGERERFGEFSWGGYLAQSFFEVFETVLSYVTNTMSFLRVGAFVLVHAGMMMVVFTLAEMTSGVGYVAIVVIGNIIVAALEGLLVAIQVLRLEFYEMFSRFFDGGGRPFIPAGSTLHRD